MSDKHGPVEDRDAVAFLLESAFLDDGCRWLRCGSGLLLTGILLLVLLVDLDDECQHAEYLVFLLKTVSLKLAGSNLAKKRYYESHTILLLQSEQSTCGY